MEFQHETTDIDIWIMLSNDNVMLKNVTSLVFLHSFLAEFFPFEALARIFPSVQKLSICHHFIANTTLDLD